MSSRLLAPLSRRELLGSTWNGIGTLALAGMLAGETDAAAVNPLAVKNLAHHDPWEFGYAAGISRPLALKASARNCSFCRENFILGVEMYGGLGDAVSPGLHETSHYLAPCLAWNLPSGWTLRVSPGFGLNGNSHGLLLRWGLSREISGFGEMFRTLFRGRS